MKNLNDELISKAEKYFNEYKIYNGTVLLNPIDLMVGFALLINEVNPNELESVRQHELTQKVCSCSPTVAIMDKNGNCKNCGKTLFK